MINNLGLSGNELLCYALIYGFSQDGESFFCGSRKYIAELIGAKSLNTVDKYIDILIGKQLIEKRSCVNNGVISNYYKVNLENQFFLDCTPPSKNEYPLSKFEHNNNSNIDNIKEERDKSLSKKEKKDELFEQCWKEYRRKGSKAQAKVQWAKLKTEDRNTMLQHIQAYVSTRELQYQKDFERYLKQRLFDTIVISNDKVIYDPTKSGNLFTSIDSNNCNAKNSEQVVINGQIYR